jgi:hypothetical protein
MPRLAPPPLQLTDTEREQLQQLVNRHSTPPADCSKSQRYPVSRGRKDSIIEKSLVNSTLAEIWQGCGAIVGWS